MLRQTEAPTERCGVVLGAEEAVALLLVVFGGGVFSATFRVLNLLIFLFLDVVRSTL